jgi:hypothetical protein
LFIDFSIFLDSAAVGWASRYHVRQNAQPAGMILADLPLDATPSNIASSKVQPVPRKFDVSHWPTFHIACSIPKFAMAKE